MTPAKKYINTIEQLKLSAISSDDFILQLSSELVLSTDLDRDEDTGKFLLSYFDGDDKFLENHKTSFFINHGGLKILFIVLSVKDKLTDNDNFIDLNHFVVCKRMFINDYGNKNLKNKPFQVDYSIDGSIWVTKHFRNIKNRVSKVKNDYCFYKLYFTGSNIKEFTFLDASITKDNYFFDLSFYYKNNYYTLYELKKTYSELNSFLFKVNSINRFSLNNKKIKELISVLEMILI